MTFDTTPEPVPAGMPASVAATVPAVLAEVAGRTDEVLAAAIASERERWVADDPELALPFDQLARMALGPGKRLRPGFCFVGWLSAGGDPTDGAGRALADRAGAALELLHTFALIHDDIMDGASTRRGQPTIHEFMAADHEGHSRRGEPRRHAEGVAILVGDLAHAMAEDLLRPCPPAAHEHWRQLQTELMLGQYLDMSCTAAGGASYDRAQRIARLKSGRYTVTRPLLVGATLHEPEPPVAATLWRYGELLGLAFQLRDDVLGAFGEPSTLGKPVGADLWSGKPTALMAVAVERADPTERKVLDRAGRPDLTGTELEAIQAIIESTGALELVTDEVLALTEQAVQAAQDEPMPDAARRHLVDLATFLAGRDY
ncbi:MAG: polyprenyl synthetase family protein [Acidimicrobiia bacterium]|nr:polyprenyl synthetase family protein [Acidimicrobiia bacterium]